MAGEYTKVAWDELAQYAYGTSRVYSGPLGCRQVAFVINRQPPGISATYHAHAASDEVCVLLRGRGRVRVGDELVEMQPLDAIRVGPGVAHANMNPSEDEEALWLVIGTPVDEYVAEEPHFYGPQAAFPPTPVRE